MKDKVDIERTDDAAIRPERFFRPSEFMRLRRPEQYSDSQEISDHPSLDKSFFEYHLETITNRSDEKPFEHFCRLLGDRAE